MPSDWRTSTLPKAFDKMLGDEEVSPRTKARARAAGPPKFGLSMRAVSKAISASPSQTNSGVLEATIAAREARREGSPVPTAFGNQRGRDRLRCAKSRSPPGIELPQRTHVERVMCTRPRSRCKSSQCSKLPVVSKRTDELSQPKNVPVLQNETAYMSFRRSREDATAEKRYLAQDCRRIHLPVFMCSP